MKRGGPLFLNRRDAGRQLGSILPLHDVTNAIVLGLPRGGVIVAAELAASLNLAADVYVVRKLRAPRSSEFAIGAVSEDGEPVIDEDVVRRLSIPESYLEAEVRSGRLEIERQVNLYRRGQSLVALEGKIVVLVDDGIATGSTVLAAISGIRSHHPEAIIVATPVCAPGAAKSLSLHVDHLASIASPSQFFAVGQHYEEFGQVSDSEVMESLR